LILLTRALAKEAHADYSEIDGIGIAVPGFIDSEKGVVMRWSNYGWNSF